MSASAAPLRRSARTLAMVRVALTMGIAVIGLAAVVANPVVRLAEAYLSAALTGVVTATETVVVPATTSFYWAAGTPRMFGAEISAECTAAFGIAGVCLIGAALAAGPRLRFARVMAGIGIGLLVVVGGNLARMTFIAYAVHQWGNDTGYEWAHVIGGSVVTVICMIAALAALVRMSLGGRSKAAPCTP